MVVDRGHRSGACPAAWVVSVGSQIARLGHPWVAPYHIDIWVSPGAVTAGLGGFCLSDGIVRYGTVEQLPGAGYRLGLAHGIGGAIARSRFRYDYSHPGRHWRGRGRAYEHARMVWAPCRAGIGSGAAVSLDYLLAAAVTWRSGLYTCAPAALYRTFGVIVLAQLLQQLDKLVGIQRRAIDLTLQSDDIALGDAFDTDGIITPEAPHAVGFFGV